MTDRAIRAIKKALNPDGFNVGYNLGAAAGAGIAAHLHQHIVPRWHGDTNFMPILAETKVISEHIDATYKKLLDVW
jgi:ATP adenylyltransferase